MLDNFSVHCTTKTHTQLEECGTIVQMLPANTTSCLQVLDVGLNKPFKNRLKSIWAEWMHSKTDDQSVTRQMISTWIADAWYDIPQSAIVNTVHSIGFSD
jgi:hypothetical protein